MLSELTQDEHDALVPDLGSILSPFLDTGDWHPAWIRAASPLVGGFFLVDLNVKHQMHQSVASSRLALVSESSSQGDDDSFPMPWLGPEMQVTLPSGRESVRSHVGEGIGVWGAAWRRCNVPLVRYLRSDDEVAFELDYDLAPSDLCIRVTSRS